MTQIVVTMPTDVVERLHDLANYSGSTDLGETLVRALGIADAAVTSDEAGRLHARGLIDAAERDRRVAKYGDLAGACIVALRPKPH